MSHDLGRAVSVVIPSTGRDTLYAAIESALSQSDVTVEVIVVLNGHDREQAYTFADRRVKFVEITQRGQGVARQTGIEHASHPVGALLDDDDRWDPRKLATQLDTAIHASERSANWIVTCGLWRGHGQSWTALPRVTPQIRIDDPASYLFSRRGLTFPDNQMQASCLLFPVSLARTVRFDNLPEIHTDWGWVLKAVQTTGAQVYTVPQHLVYYDLGDGSSASKVSKGEKSLDWAQEYLASSPGGVRGDFLMNITARIFARSGDVRGVWRALREALTSGRPSASSIMLVIPLTFRALSARFARTRR